MHWLKLLWDGMTQKMWLRLQGFRKTHTPSETVADSGVNALV